MKKAQQTNGKSQQSLDLEPQFKGAPRPLWQVIDNAYAVLNINDLPEAAQKLLKKFTGKKATDTKTDELKSLIVKEWGEIPKAPVKATPKAEPKQEEAKAKAEVASAKDKPKDKPKDKEKVDAKDKTDKPKNNKPKKERVFNEGDIVPVGTDVGIKILSADVKPKVGQIAFIPDYQGSGESKADDLFMEVTYIGKNTVWFVEMTTENAIAGSPNAIKDHYLDFEDEKGNIVPEDQWIPFFLCELVDLAPKEEKPKAEPKAETKKDNKKKKKVVVKSGKKSA